MTWAYNEAKAIIFAWRQIFMAMSSNCVRTSGFLQAGVSAIRFSTIKTNQQKFPFYPYDQILEQI